jgi:RES domain-containing protein
VRQFAGRVWRHVPAGAVPLHLGKLWKYAEGRWNRRGEYACLYTALTRQGALAEAARARARYGAAPGARDLVSIDVRLSPILDLTDATEHRRAASKASVSPDAALLVAGGDEACEHCRRLSDWARAEGFTGLLVPSAAAPGEVNLVIYFDVVAPKQLEIDDGPDREPVPS